MGRTRVDITAPPHITFMAAQDPIIVEADLENCIINIICILVAILIFMIYQKKLLLKLLKGSTAQRSVLLGFHIPILKVWFG